MKKLLLLSLLIALIFNVGAKNKLYIITNPKTCKNCMYFFKEVSLIDSSIQINFVFESVYTNAQLNTFLNEKFTSLPKNHKIIRDDSLVTYIFNLNENNIVYGAVAIINDSGKMITNFTIKDIPNNVTKINWLCKNYQIKTANKTINETSNLMDKMSHLAKNKNSQAIAYEKDVYIYDCNNTLIKNINFKSDSNCLLIYKFVHKTSKGFNHFIKTSKSNPILNPYSFINVVMDNEVINFVVRFDSSVQKGDQGHHYGIYILGTYLINKDSLYFTSLNYLNQKLFSLIPEYLKIFDNNNILIGVESDNKGANKPALVYYKKVKNRFVFNKFHKVQINTSEDKYNLLYPLNIFINDSFIIQYESLTLNEIGSKNKVRLKIENEVAERIKESYSFVANCTKLNNIYQVFVIHKNYLIEYYFDKNGKIIENRRYNLGNENYNSISNCAVNNNEFTFINERNELVVINIEPVNE